MNKLFVIIMLILCGYTLKAQLNNVSFFQESDTKINSVGAIAIYQGTIYAGLNYSRVLKLRENSKFNRNIALQAEIISPLYLISDRNKRLNISAATFIRNKIFDVKVLGGLSLMTYQDVMAKGSATFYSLGIQPGYYKNEIFIATNIDYTNNIYTTFKFSESYPLKNTILYNTTGYFNFGLNIGLYIKEKLEIGLQAAYKLSRTLKNYPPFSQNIGFSVGVNYRF